MASKIKRMNPEFGVHIGLDEEVDIPPLPETELEDLPEPIGVTGYQFVQDFLIDANNRNDVKIVGYSHGETPKKHELFRDLSERFQEVITVRLVVKKP